MMVSGFYDFGMDPLWRKLLRPGKPVRHQQTCPACGRRGVNTYRRGNDWKCLKCWKEAPHE